MPLSWEVLQLWRLDLISGLLRCSDVPCPIDFRTVPMAAVLYLYRAVEPSCLRFQSCNTTNRNSPRSTTDNQSSSKKAPRRLKNRIFERCFHLSKRHTHACRFLLCLRQDHALLAVRVVGVGFRPEHVKDR